MIHTDEAYQEFVDEQKEIAYFAGYLDCPHTETIDIGDEEHWVIACTLCGHELPYKPVVYIQVPETYDEFIEMCSQEV